MAHIDGPITGDPAVYARLPKVHRDALAYLLGINALRASEAAGVRIEDHADPRTTEHYDHARGNLDRHGVHFLTAHVASG